MNVHPLCQNSLDPTHKRGQLSSFENHRIFKQGLNAVATSSFTCGSKQSFNIINKPSIQCLQFLLLFQDFILEHYSEDGADYENAIAEFMDIRQAMRTPTRDANGISLLFEHFNQLYFVERRFFPPDRSLGIYFEW